ncbi:substrate-binding domain-containing protein [Nocardioides ungokensis]|uniref:substrate-binding domain-containing protein n=1 Tax=Nocardioides ungokensis TaxID=1643322 RepID=UPI0015DE686E|nr:substrate-binding domain-containing protein [Nocardioides ungokensis]
MSARSLLAGLATTAVVTTALSLVTLAPASAVYRTDPDDTAFTATAADLIGAGSDTTQHAVKLLADAWNADSSHTFKVATYAATEGGAPKQADATIPLPGGTEATRPNGSGDGKSRLYGTGNVPQIDFARSSDALSTTETDNGLKAFPFALDTVVMAVSNSTPSHAPASITVNDLVKIYECQAGATDWSDFGGTAGTIEPQIPQSGSGTAKFFKKQLDAAKGSAVTYGACVNQNVQEHDDSTVKDDANAVVPISKGRAELKGGTVRLMDGFAAKRDLYNVVRGGDVTKPEIQAVFGENGFICSTEARDLIAQAGFQQLATPAHGGVCGTPVDTTSNFTVNQQVVTATTSPRPAARPTRPPWSPRSPAPRLPRARSRSTTAPACSRPTCPVSGQATYNATGLSAGSHDFRAAFTPASGSAFDPSQGTSSATVKTASKVTESFPASIAKGQRAKGVVTVVLTGVANAATGKVKVLLGRKTLATARSPVAGRP